MKRILLVLCAFALLLAACAAQLEPDITSTEPTILETTMAEPTTPEITSESITITSTKPSTTTKSTTGVNPPTGIYPSTGLIPITNPPTGNPQNRGYAFYQVFLDLGSEGIKYIAVDMSGVPKDSRATLERLLREHCAGTGQTFLIATMEQLERQGYIDAPDDSIYKSFPDGAHYAFTGGDGAAGAAALTIQGRKWWGSLAGIGATYTVILNGDEWAVGRVDMRWVS